MAEPETTVPRLAEVPAALCDDSGIAVEGWSGLPA